MSLDGFAIFRVRWDLIAPLSYEVTVFEGNKVHIDQHHALWG